MAELTYIPLLKIQRELYDVPDRRERFATYLRTMFNADGSDLDLAPLTMMNPMAKPHVAALLDALIAVNADGAAAKAAASAAPVLADLPGDYRAALVIADDLKGGWTNRYACEFQIRFGQPDQPLSGPAHRVRRNSWVCGVLWSSEEASTRSAERAIQMAIYRLAYIYHHGRAATLAQRLAQEGAVMAWAGVELPEIPPEELAYSRQVIAPCLNETDMATTISCLFGDAAGKTLGFAPLGLSLNAGLGVALEDAKSGSQI